jgi:hypothetical protein
MKRIVLVSLVLIVTLAVLAIGQPSQRGDAQDRTDERLAAIETQVASQATTIARHSKSIKSLRSDVNELQTQVAGGAPSAANSSSGTPTEEPVPAEAPTAVPTEAPSGPVGSFTNPVPYGETATLPGDWTLKVIDVITNATDQVMAENQFNDPPAEGRQFFIVRVSATNNSNQPASIRSIASFSAVGKSAVAYETYEDRCGVIPDELSDAEVFPGGTIEGNICWSVKKEDVKTLVMFVDSYVTFDQKDRVYFSLRKK